MSQHELEMHVFNLNYALRTGKITLEQAVERFLALVGEAND